MIVIATDIHINTIRKVGVKRDIRIDMHNKFYPEDRLER